MSFRINIKAIPRIAILKDHFEFNPYTQEEDCYWLLHCPTCDNIIGYSDIDDFDVEQIYNYCYKCGQKLSREWKFED